MFRQLLVPLDGSTMAEAALPCAAALAGRFGAELTLVHILERRAPRTVHGQRHLTSAAEADAYLAQTAAALPPGLTVHRHVHRLQVTDVAASIAEHADELAPDLVVMCAHGNDTLRNWFSGSVAQHVIARRMVPVLCVRADDGTTAAACTGGPVLVPLDGAPDHEQGLDTAARLAAAWGAPLHLVTVIPTADTLKDERRPGARLMPGTAASLLELQTDGAASYLRGHAALLAPRGIAVSVAVLRGSPAREIAAEARRLGSACIVLTSHGTTGLDAFWAGSVTPALARQTRVPLLLIPVA